MDYDLSRDKVQYVIAGSHLDTQWRWTIQQTVDEFLVRTMLDNFALFEKFPGYVLSFEGAYRYMLMKKHYPTEYETLKQYVKKGNWVPVGSMIEMPDVNMPCPESLARQILYGNLFFEQEFGRRSVDIYLPDCFGFGYALPTIGAHCGLKGFSAWKLLSWRGGTYRDESDEVQVGIPFDIGVWEGVDGSSLIAALNPGFYMGKWRSREEDFEKVAGQTGLWLNYHYFGVGDRGGAKPEEDVCELMERIARNDHGDGVKVINTSSEQMYKDLTPEQIPRLPRYRGELICTQASGGFYTAEARLKRWNRMCELRANAGERARTITYWLGTLSYPAEALHEAWVQFLWHQVHDDLAGVSIAEASDISENDYRRAYTVFDTVTSAGVKSLACLMETQAEGKACLVFNSLSCEREDVVTVAVNYGKAEAPEHIRVFDKDNNEVPSEILATKGKTLTVSFLAKVPAVGGAVFDIRASDRDCQLETGLHADRHGLENTRYKVSIDQNGDICSILDKTSGRELLAGSIRLELLNDYSPLSPAWNITWDDIRSDPKEYVSGPATVTVESSGPVNTRLRIERKLAESTFSQILKLAAGDAADTLEVETTIQWQTHERLLKVGFPLSVSNPKATYDIGLGVVQRGNNSQRMHEVPAQQWADITDADGSYGVSILSDCKYGWDKPQDNKLRLTLLHTPGVAEKHPEQAELDVGQTHHLRYGICGHEGDWRQGNSVALGERLNQPLLPVVVPSHEGTLGRTFGFLRTNSEQLSVMALKKAERSDDIIVRVRETQGKALPGARVYFASEVESATEVDGQEFLKGEASYAGNYIQFDISGFQPRAFAVKLRPYRPQT